MFLNLNSCFWIKYEFIYFLSTLKKSGLAWICTDQEPFTVQNSSKQICEWILMWETTGEGLFHWRKCYYGLWTHILARSNSLKLKCLLNDEFVYYKPTAFSSQDINCWTGVVWITCGSLWCFYQLFGLSFWRHPFTAEHPLLSKWCNATFLQIWWRNKLIYILDGLRVNTFSANFHFQVNYEVIGTIKITDSNDTYKFQD